MRSFGKQDKLNPRDKKIGAEFKNSEKDLINLALKYHSEGKIKEASKYYHLYLNRGHLDSRVLINYGAICKQLGETDQAIRLYKECIDLYPNIPEAYSNLANIFIGISNLKEAEILIRKSIQLKHNLANSYFNSISNRYYCSLCYIMYMVSKLI